MRVSSQLEVGQVTDTVTVSAGRGDAADRSRRRAHRHPVGAAREPAGAGRPQLPEPVRHRSRASRRPRTCTRWRSIPARGLAFSSNGTTRNANSIRIEGAISNNLWLPHVAAYVPALEAIESVGVTTSTFDADQGLSGGMSANVLIKSGTNALRGSAFEYFYDEALKSRPYFLPATEQKPETQPASVRRHARRPDRPQQGVLLRQLPGHLRSARWRNRFGTVPTAAMRNGDFSGVADADLRPAHRRGQRQRPHGVLRQHHPARALRSDRAEAARAVCRCRTCAGLADNYFATGDVHVRSAQRRRQGELQPDARKLGLVRPRRLARLRVPQPADVRRARRPAGQLDRGQGGHRPRRHLHLHRQRVVRRLADVPGRRLYRRHDDRRSRSEPDRLDENLGLRLSRAFPAPTARDRLYGGWPHFSDHQLLEHRLRGQQPLALHRRQLAGAVHRQRDLDEGRAHAQVRRRHRPPGDEPARARRRRPAASPSPAGRRRSRAGPPANQFNNYRRVPARPADAASRRA